MTTKAEKEKDQLEAVNALHELLEPGDTVYTVLRHVSRSGMSRAIDAYIIQDSEPRWISRLAARAMDGTFSERYEAVSMGGCGMDMGFALVYNLSRALWVGGFGCIGENCPSNDHSNGDRSYTRHSPLDGIQSMTAGYCAHWHQSGGYALRHRWM